eukprot:TRINITY_DN1707_c0_g1_i1.p3 TRINITY_DN1707_c0_g1~~TRINITY_DN1707_c0_g1_i1.p3  ORF type:complete len:147 (-),score=3.17 TRINITY_DN1707_c0_g1_i1:395-835(-)
MCPLYAPIAGRRHPLHAGHSPASGGGGSPCTHRPMVTARTATRHTRPGLSPAPPAAAMRTTEEATAPAKAHRAPPTALPGSRTAAWPLHSVGLAVTRGDALWLSGGRVERGSSVRRRQRRHVIERAWRHGLHLSERVEVDASSAGK